MQEILDCAGDRKKFLSTFSVLLLMLQSWIIRALLEIRYDRFSRGFECDSKAGCGRQHNEAAWPELHARRNAI
ncbi:hypothetical protein, partial [Acetobacter pasteurianus]|uniref:hypothetical protein n=1 Tax=Acetobacter pasteurianus TaxID=438 RepID=UPI00216B6757